VFDQCRKPGIGQSSAGSQTLETPLINTSVGNQTEISVTKTNIIIITITITVFDLPFSKNF
jgi:hypothetical protein